MLISTSANPIPLFHSNNPEWKGKLNSEESAVLFDDVKAAQKSLRETYKPPVIINKTLQSSVQRTSKTVEKERINLLNELREVLTLKPNITDSRSILRDTNNLKGYQVIYWGGDTGNTGMLQMQDMVKAGYALESCRSMPNSTRIRAVLVTDQYDKEDTKAIAALHKERCEKHERKVQHMKDLILKLSEEYDTLKEEEERQAAADQLNDNDILLNSLLNKD